MSPSPSLPLSPLVLGEEREGEHSSAKGDDEVEI